VPGVQAFPRWIPSKAGHWPSKWAPLVVALGAGTLTLCGQTTAFAGIASPTAAQRYARTMSDVRYEKSVAWTSVISSPGGRRPQWLE
jgi:hypothetical protein